MGSVRATHITVQIETIFRADMISPYIHGFLPAHTTFHADCDQLSLGNCTTVLMLKLLLR